MLKGPCPSPATVGSGIVSLLGASGILETAIGVLWCQLLAHQSHISLSGHHYSVLGASIWMAYAGDRLLDSLGQRAPATMRHQLHARYWRQIGLLWLVVGIGTLGFSLAELTRAEWAGCGTLLGMTLLYLLLARKLGNHTPLLKKLIAASIYTAGTTVFVWTNPDSELGLPLAVYASLVVANLVCIGAVETRSTESGLLRWAQLSLFTLGISVSAQLLAMTRSPRIGPYTLAAPLSGSLVFLLWYRRSKLAPERFHQLADGALLAPLPLLLL